MKKLKLPIIILCTFTIGFLLGAAAIHRPIPGAPVELPPPRKPWIPKDITGLIGSAGIRMLAGNLEMIPTVILETDTTFALSVSSSKTRPHFVIVPKKDIADTSTITAGDSPYLMDIFLTARQIIEKEGLHDYRIYTNGPGLQTVGYLHFHLVGKRPSH